MLNDRSSPLALLLSRRSAKPRDMLGPGPSDADLETILSISARVPDHGQLTPWRFVVVAEDQRDALADLFLRALAAEEPGATEAHRRKELDVAHYPGTLVVLISAPIADHKIPLWEQELSCGAAGMNLLNAATALGYVAGWITGWRAYSPTVSASFCGAGERIAGFVFIGHSELPLEERPRPDLPSIVSTWQGSAA